MIYICQPGADALAKALLARLERHARVHLRLNSQTFRDRTDPTVRLDSRPRWKDEVKPMLEKAQTRPGHLVVPSMNHIALTCGTQRETYQWAHELGITVHCTDPQSFSAQDFLGDTLNVLVRLEEVYRLTRRLRHARAEAVLAACGHLRKHLADALPLARQRQASPAGHRRLHAAIQEGERLLAPHTRSHPREELHHLAHCLRTLLPPELTGPWNDPWSPAPLHGTAPARA
ncbi:hypothetical protein AB0A98_22665 [Streptomyces chrestomyceticus]|uniref:hypothetical protein n=1 Tax=Streptomyces chrestomyceticus TaxID=68185 RepID=UPI0033F7689F